MRTKKSRHVVGFSLVELLASLLILVLLTGLAAPVFTNILMTNRLATESNSFLSALHLARSEAVKRNAHVVLCISTSGVACSASGDWHQRWIMFSDANNNALFDANETLLRQGQALPPNVLLTGNTPVAKYISYVPSGATRLVTGALQMGTLKLCHTAANNGDARLLILSSTGRPRIKKTTVASCP